MFQQRLRRGERIATILVAGQQPRKIKVGRKFTTFAQVQNTAGAWVRANYPDATDFTVMVDPPFAPVQESE